MELLLGREDSEVFLTHILRNASRRGGRIFEIFSSKEKSDHSVESKMRWNDRQSLKAVHEEKARRDVQEVDVEINQYWTAVYQWIAKKMLRSLEDSECLKVSTGELKKQVLYSDESSVNIERIARQARSEKSRKLFQIFRQGCW